MDFGAKAGIYAMIGLGAFLVLMFLGYLAILFFPLKTIEFVQPVQIDNPRPAPTADNPKPLPQVPLGGVIEMTINYRKYTDAPGLIVRTLVRKKGKEIIVIDSSTVVSNRKKGAGITHGSFAVLNNPLAVGRNCYVVFSIYYHLFAGRTEMRQFETEPFEIVPGGAPCPPNFKH